MPNPSPKIFKKSLLAVAILTLSGCASAPKMDDVDLSPIGEGILVAGRATAEIGVHAWDVSMYMLGFTDDASQRTSENVVDTTFPLDEIDEAMLKDDALPPEDTLNSVEIVNATANYDDVFETPTTDELIGLSTALESDPLLIQPEFLDGDIVDIALTELAPVELFEEEILAETIDVDAADEQDYIHKVGNNETLWDIAKATTGDATNWHLLADANDLNQDAGIFVGQSLVIPADMLKPEFKSEGLNINTGESLIASAPAPTEAQVVGEAKKPIVIAAIETDTLSSRLPIPAAVTGTSIELNTGETLWDFAKRTTGDATNWKAIAGHNNFTEREAVIVQPGQSILVPEDLIKTNVTVASAAPITKQVISDVARAEVQAAIEKVNQSAISASSELLTEASSLSNAQLFGDETQPITIVEANFQADPSQQPIKIASDAIEVVRMTQPSLDQIMISGTYYPKAIYNDADFSSSLLMRVSPGTSLKVSKALGNWFEVETDKGTGYVHQRDIK